MGIILDADVVICGEKGEFDLEGWVATRPDDQFELTAITVAELWHGVERASPSHKLYRQQYLRAVIDALPVIPYTEQAAYRHARLWASLESSGSMIGPHDLILAAIALDRGSAVATYNQRHFSRVKGLRIIEPEK